MATVVQLPTYAQSENILQILMAGHRYPMKEPITASGKLEDLAFNHLMLAADNTEGTIALEFPDAAEVPEGSVKLSRDFILRIEVAAGEGVGVPAITIPAELSYEGDALPTITRDANVSKAYYLTFSETKENTFLVVAFVAKAQTIA